MFALDVCKQLRLVKDLNPIVKVILATFVAIFLRKQNLVIDDSQHLILVIFNLGMTSIIETNDTDGIVRRGAKMNKAHAFPSFQSEYQSFENIS